MHQTGPLNRKRKNDGPLTPALEPRGALAPRRIDYEATVVQPPLKKHKKPERGQGELNVDNRTRLAYMDIIFSGKSVVDYIFVDAPVRVASCPMFPLQFTHTHADGHKDVCRLTPLVSTTETEMKGKVGLGFQMYALDADPAVKFIGKIISANDPEVHAVNALMDMDPSNRCNVIQARVIDRIPSKPKHKMTLMPEMDGDLDSDSFASLMSSATPANRKLYIRNIMASIHEQINCLNRVNLIYNDIKPPNILYSYDQKSNTLKVQLCDLGSCKKTSSTEFVTTIPCFQKPYALSKQEKIAEEDEVDQGQRRLSNKEIALQCQQEVMGVILIYLFWRFIKEKQHLTWYFARFKRREIVLAYLATIPAWRKKCDDLIIKEMPDMKQYIHRDG